MPTFKDNGAPRGENLVSPDLACPGCGQRDADRLIWQDDFETVRCATCGTVYRPGIDPDPDPRPDG